MTERKPIRSEEELAEAFDQLFSEIPPPQTEEEINEYIIEAGYDPDEFGEQIKNIASEALKNSPLNWRNQIAQSEIEEARSQLEKINELANKDRKDIFSIIEKVMAQIKEANPQLAPVHYRNRSELSEEDLVSLLQELLFIANQSNIDIDLGE